MSKNTDPKSNQHPDLESFYPNNSGGHQKTVDISGQRLNIILDVGHLEAELRPQALEKSANLFAKHFSDLKTRLRQCQELIANAYLEKAQQYDSKLGTNKKTKLQFLKCIRLKDITVHPEGCSFWFEDGDCLGGHGIVVSFGPRGGLKGEPWLVG
ncbi:MAG: DUF2262 domain-containing protein [Planctomycetota bacterium]